MTHVPWYQIDLDLEPEKRWENIIPVYAKVLDGLNDFLDQNLVVEFGYFLGLFVIKPFLWLLSWLSFIFVNKSYIQEIKSISLLIEKNGGNTNFHQLLMMNLAYDLIVKCTSIVYKDDQNRLWHLRNMDWVDSSDNLLKRTTINIEWFKNGELVFISTNWVGMVGVLTGMTTMHQVGKNFGISINYRKESTSCWTSLKTLFYLFWIHRQPVSFLVREWLEIHSDVESIQKQIHSFSIYVPVYITISNDQKSILITRSIKQKDCSFDKLLPIVQTNIDQDVNQLDMEWVGYPPDPLLLNSIERRNKSRELIQSIDFNQKENLIVDDCFKLLQTEPIFSPDDLTLFSVVMSPNHKIIYKTLVYS